MTMPIEPDQLTKEMKQSITKLEEVVEVLKTQSKEKMEAMEKQNKELVDIVEALKKETKVETGLADKINTAITDIQTLQMRGRKSSICGYRHNWQTAGTITYSAVHTEVDEVNSVLDANTGIYTAGINGVYEISLSGFAQVSPGGRVTVHIEGAGNGNEDKYFIYSRNHASNGGENRDTAAATRHVTLTAGQQISLKYSHEGNADFFRIKFCVTLY